METKKKQRLIVSLLIVFSLIALFGSLRFVMKESTAENLRKLVSLSNGSVKDVKEIDLKTAIDLGMKEAQKWSAFAELVEVSSADDGDNTVGIRGTNGLRYSWNLFFVDEKKSKYYYIKILNGKIILQKDAQGYPYGPVRLTSLKVDSMKALEIAKNYKDLKPGQKWAIGYHYMLTQPKDSPIMTVFGYSSDGNFSFVEINAENGKVISAKKKIYDQKGKGSWLDY